METGTADATTARAPNSTGTKTRPSSRGPSHVETRVLNETRAADATTVRAPNSNLERKCRVRNKQGWATSSIELAATESICIDCAHDEVNWYD
jgi:hypothetical protein